MPKITKPLTDTEIRSASAKDKDYYLYDGKGLILLVKRNGSKLWRYKYQHPVVKKVIQLGIGSYPEISLADARKVREEGNSLLATRDPITGIGLDPQTLWKTHKADAETAHLNTFEHVAKSWHVIKSEEVSEDHAHDIWRSIEKNILPEIGNLPIRSLDAPTIIQVLKPIEARGSLETIRRLCQRINEIMDYAANTGLIHANPATGIKKAFKRPKKVNLPSLKPDGLAMFLQTMFRTNISQMTRCVIEWQLHTMTRPSEAAGTQWAEIDFESKVWTIPAERMKSNKSHTIPLTSQALAILSAMSPISGNRDHVFASTKNPRTHMNAQTANAAISRMGYKDQLVAHGLRSIASTTLNEHGFDPDVIEAALAHVDKNEVRRSYNRAEYLERRRTMMQWWSDFIDQAATGKMSVVSNIQPLRA
jgi:integrase